MITLLLTKENQTSIITNIMYTQKKKSHINNKYCLLYRKWYAPQFGRLPSGFQSSKHGRVVPILLLTTLIMYH